MKINAMDLLLQIPDNQMPYNAISLFKQSLSKDRKQIKKEITDDIKIITYLDLNKNALGVFQNNLVVNVFYFGVWYKCYVDDIWQDEHNLHDGNLFGCETKTIIELSIIEE